MRGSKDAVGMPDVRSHRAFFRFEIVCQDQPLELELESTPNFPHSEMYVVRGPFGSIMYERICSLPFLTSSSVAVFRSPNSDSTNGVCFVTSRQASKILAPETPHHHAAFPNIRPHSSSEGDGCMKDTDHPIRHPLRHSRIFGRVRSRRGCVWHGDQIGRGQNTGLGWSDPTFVHASVPKVIRGVAPAQLRGDRAECFVQRSISQQGTTVMNNGDESQTELLTVHGIATLLKVPVSWVYEHSFQRE